MIREAIVLAGGLGTRLRSILNETPKPMALIQEKPFLEYLLIYLINQGIQKVILSVGYKHDIIQNYFGSKFQDIDLQYVIEDTPLGTGGAIKKAAEKTESSNYFVFNGDTFFQVNLEKLFYQHQQSKADITLALKQLKNFSRYGVVKTNKNGRVTSFSEKRKHVKGNINGGVFLINTKVFKQFVFPQKFSMEEDVIQKKVKNLMIYSYLTNAYFIDIGVPEDYRKAQQELPNYLIQESSQSENNESSYL